MNNNQIYDYSNYDFITHPPKPTLFPDDPRYPFNKQRIIVPFVK
jgi:hypothetical protein